MRDATDPNLAGAAQAVHRPRGNAEAGAAGAKRLAFRTNDTNKILARIARPVGAGIQLRYSGRL